ncbi:hypothetical protein FDE76_08730 [Clostridium botulinum]|uniref:Uncharacterized protein n=1 Tax=Clostridium botulinum (strain Eklund 17B / Type B) TaxID=935198 RepID=B2TJQ0_CLOBB|nr:hypothetical protein CLL_A1439 [Clostridium botulinum B str. Eklund 17B (NRP)]MBY6974749.1 hypothetical protein [Clostridium botulinum]MBY6999735.1 hypothetical protein [Clostridium botulinum]MCR1275032.1 hypothetical protein [Clostridium botulinum]NFD70717.1 hypothetical protein [Clostridium botulinum]
MDNIAVKLTTDLTKYEKGLVPGIKGVTVGQKGIWSRCNDNFISVKFENNITLDVLWSGLEIIDEDYLKTIAENEKKLLQELKSAKNIVKSVGPRGGFRYLCYEYITLDGSKCSASTGFKKEADKLLKIFSNYKLNVKIEKIV